MLSEYQRNYYATYNFQSCHPERSEGSGLPDEEILPLRCTQGFGSRAQDDRQDTSQVRSRTAGNLYQTVVILLYGHLL